MKVYQISAVTLVVRSMERSCNFYSQIPGFEVEYGGTPTDAFTSYRVGDSSRNMHLNLELNKGDDAPSQENLRKQDFGRIIFHTDDVDSLYSSLSENSTLSQLISLEEQPRDAPWGERFFHVRDPDRYQLSFAMPIKGK
jgi:catechol 2,3-dioxygenase-like lactoylglutathione lyase family enzyme